MPSAFLAIGKSRFGTQLRLRLSLQLASHDLRSPFARTLARVPFEHTHTHTHTINHPFETVGSGNTPLCLTYWQPHCMSTLLKNVRLAVGMTYQEQERAKERARGMKEQERARSAHTLCVRMRMCVANDLCDMQIPLLPVDLGYILDHFDLANHRKYDFRNTILDHLTLAASLTIGFGSTV